MLDSLRALVSFLTVIPAGRHNIDDAARVFYLSPAVGILIGAIGAGVGAGTLYFVGEPLLAAAFAAGAIALATGLHHVDGLADFADGLMRRGSKAERLAAMEDTATGTGGASAIALSFLLLVAALYAAASGGNGAMAFFGIILAGEVAAKFSMVVGTYAGGTAPESTASRFAVHSDPAKLAAALGITLVIIWIISGAWGILSLLPAAASALIISAISRRVFGRITGDVLGATNEISRISCILFLVIL